MSLSNACAKKRSLCHNLHTEKEILNVKKVKKSYLVTKKFIFVYLKLKNMKKILFVALALLVTGTMYADKKCCKDKAKCDKEAAAKTCSHDEANGKACCKKGTAAVGSEAKTEDMATCCKKSVAGGGKACCSKGAAHADAPKPQPAPQAAPVRDDQH